jgi:hypothetical protein
MDWAYDPDGGKKMYTKFWWENLLVGSDFRGKGDGGTAQKGISGKQNVKMEANVN